ncbi:MAG: HAMP domain-containing sensor histidine kinase [Burkholderiaceae bacterium]
MEDSPPSNIRSADPPDRSALERAYRDDAAFVVSIAPWMFAIGMATEAALHWGKGPGYIFWAHAAMAIVSFGLALTNRLHPKNWHHPEIGLLCFWLFMLTSVIVHTAAYYPDRLRLPQLVMAVTVVATGVLILPTVAGWIALIVSSIALLWLFVAEYSFAAIENASIPLVVFFMALLAFLARRWVVRQGFEKRELDRRLTLSIAEAETAKRVAEHSMRISSGFSHHFNNQLQSALIGADGVRRILGDEHAAGEWLDIIEMSLRRGIDLTGELRRYAQQAPLKTRSLSAVSFIAGLDPAGEVLGKRILHRSADDVSFIADEEQLGFAITELLRNADASMRSNLDPVRLELTDSDDSVIVSVSDTGTGFVKSLAGPPTEPFVTSDPVRRFGLGLSIAARIVHLHQGTLEFRHGPAGGTIASIRIPKSLAAAKPG